MEQKLTTEQVKDLLNHVIRTVDRWWDKVTDGKSGCFIRSNIPCVVYGYYVEWRYSATRDSRDYASIIISLKYEGDVDYIRMALRKMKDNIYTEYDPFCEIYDGKVDVTISEDTGGYDEWFSIFGKGWINDLTDNIATTVCRFTEPSYDEKTSDVNMDDVSKTLSAHDIQDCMIKAMRIMLIDRDTVNELLRLSHMYYGKLPPTQCNSKLGYAFEVTPKHVVTRIVYIDTYTFNLCIFTCEPDAHGQHEFIIRYNSCDTGFKYDQGFNILYKDSEGRCFEYTADGLDVEKIFKPFVNILRNTLNYELYQQLTKPNVEEVKKQQQETCEESKEETMDTETNALAIKPGLMPKEIYVLDTSYFVIGDIYLLEIDPVYDWSKISTTPIKVPRWVYAICEDVCSTVIHFMLGSIDGHDQLFTMPVHADEIESGLVTVKRVLMNETLIQNTDEGAPS